MPARPRMFTPASELLLDLQRVLARRSDETVVAAAAQRGQVEHRVEVVLVEQVGADGRHLPLAIAGLPGDAGVAEVVAPDAVARRRHGVGVVATLEREVEA